MLLTNCELIPAVIQSTNDPQKLGRIKCVIPGIVDNSTMSEENMPWVRPLFMNSSQSFSKPMKGFKVWVLMNKANYNEYWYFPFFEYNDISKEFLESVYDNDQPEIFMSHNNGGNHAMSTYDEQNGFSQKIGNNHIELHPNGKVELVGGQTEVRIENSDVYVGKQGEAYEPMVLGNKLKSMLNGLAQQLTSLSVSALLNPYTAALGKGLGECAKIVGNTTELLSTNANVN